MALPPVQKDPAGHVAHTESDAVPKVPPRAYVPAAHVWHVLSDDLKPIPDAHTTVEKNTERPLFCLKVMVPLDDPTATQTEPVVVVAWANVSARGELSV